MTRSCWKSFCPKQATSGWRMLNNFATTWHTPRKCPGRCLPSSASVSCGRSTTISDSCRRIHLLGGRIEDADRRPARGIFPDRIRSGADTSLKSSRGPNCVGFTKMLTAVNGAECLAYSISDRCPRCSAPIVGTSASLPSLARCARHSAIVFTTVIWSVGYRKKAVKARRRQGARVNPAGLLGDSGEVWRP